MLHLVVAESVCPEISIKHMIKIKTQQMCISPHRTLYRQCIKMHWVSSEIFFSLIIQLKDEIWKITWKKTSVQVYLSFPPCILAVPHQNDAEWEIVCILSLCLQPWRKTCWDWLQMVSLPEKNVPPLGCLLCMHDQAPVNASCASLTVGQEEVWCSQNTCPLLQLGPILWKWNT